MIVVRKATPLEQLKRLIVDNGCPQFASLLYTSKPSGARLTAETARHTVILGASLDTLYLRDLEFLKKLAREMVTTHTADEIQACAELIVSKEESLTLGIGNNLDATSADAYDYLDCPGLKIHRESGDIHIMGLAHTKVIIGEPATYREVKSRNGVTHAKKWIRDLLPSARLRQFNLGNADTRMKIHGDVLVFGDGE